jgi:hypothetical protein
MHQRISKELFLGKYCPRKVLLANCSMNPLQMSLLHKNKQAKTSRPNLFRSRARYTFPQSLATRISNFLDFLN